MSVNKERLRAIFLASISAYDRSPFTMARKLGLRFFEVEPGVCHIVGHLDDYAHEVMEYHRTAGYLFRYFETEEESQAGIEYGRMRHDKPPQ